MRRGVVLSFPSPRGLRDDDRASLQRFVAAVPGAQADILISRDRRGVAILTLAGRHLWVTRDQTGLGARDASSGQELARDSCIGRLLATVHTALLPDSNTACCGRWKVSPSAPCGLA